IKIPTPQLQDVYKRWKGLEPTGVEQVDRAREYYIGLLRKELQERGALPDNPGRLEEREARRVLALPGEEKRISPALAIIPIGLGLGLAAVVGMVALAQAAPPQVYTCPICGAEFSTSEELEYHMATVHPPEPSSYLKELQRSLDDLIYNIEMWGERDEWFYVPGYGLIGSVSWGTADFIKQLMIEEAINIGLISSAGECYFVRAIMYYSDGTIIVG
ncbi:unnamed protein product, partial [marine sediment metagenome]